MNADLFFTISNVLAAMGWLLLLLLPNSPLVKHILLGVVIMIFCIAYAVFLNMAFAGGVHYSFSSLDALLAMLSNKNALMAGWLHYLAFDLLAGLFIAHNGYKHGVPYLALLPCLLLTLFAGPVGLGIYLLMRWHFSRHYFAENF